MLTGAEAAEVAGITPDHLRRLCQRGLGPHRIRVGPGPWRYDSAALGAWVEGRRRPGRLLERLATCGVCGEPLRCWGGRYQCGGPRPHVQRAADRLDAYVRAELERRDLRPDAVRIEIHPVGPGRRALGPDDVVIS